MAKEVAKKKSTNIVEFDQELLLADSGAGLEGMTSEDFMIPRITILQQMSPAVNKRDGAYVEGADPGHILDLIGVHILSGKKTVVDLFVIMVQILESLKDVLGETVVSI